MDTSQKREKLILDESQRSILAEIVKSRTRPACHVFRAGILLGFADGKNIATLCREFSTNRKLVERTIDRALAFGSMAALSDLQRSGKKKVIDDEAINWVINLACESPQKHGYAAETWTQGALAKHVRANCVANGHPTLLKAMKGTINKMLAKAGIRPHKISYYLERRDPDFEPKRTQILHVYKEVMIANESNAARSATTVSYDEKPGIQALKNIAPQLPPVPGKHPNLGRDYEYRRLGTVSILAGIDLHTGHIFHKTYRRHRSSEFIEFLKMLDENYPPEWHLRMVLDNHSAHKSKETMSFLQTRPNRFEFVFTPTHGSWLNIIEMVFSKMSRGFLRHIRVDSIDELRERIDSGIEEMNQEPVVFKWKYKMDEISLETAPAASGDALNEVREPTVNSVC